jgi:formiminotetrahydrofolate cyclodeaminase
MLIENTVSRFLDELASNSPAPGGGSAAALAGAVGAALTSMVCRLTIGKKKYERVEPEMKNILKKAEESRLFLTRMIDRDAEAFDKVMEAYGLPKETEDQKALRSAAIQGATKEAALVPLELMKHMIDVFALARTAAEKGNSNSVSDAGVSAVMLHAACESAALNVQINLVSITDTEFVGWRTDEIASLRRTSASNLEQVLAIVGRRIAGA